MSNKPINKKTIGLISRICIDIREDAYYIKLLSKIEYQYAENFLSGKNFSLKEKELYDLLKYADIFSSSSKGEDINTGYKIITLLQNRYKDTPIFMLFSKSILSKIGNFPAINLMRKTGEVKLPFEIEAKNIFKQDNQKTPDGNGVFTDIQYDIFQKIIGKNDFSFSGPTSLGKSFILLMFVKYIFKNKTAKNIVIIVPTRALITQVSIDVREELKKDKNIIDYQILTNSNVSEINLENQGNIFVLTPERLSSLLSIENIPTIDLLFVDEAHKIFINNDTRSITEYATIEHAIRRFGNLQIIFASPNVTNPGKILSLFGKPGDFSLQTNQKLVAQNLFLIDTLEKNTYFFSEDGNKQIIVDITPSFFDGNTLDIVKKLGNGDKCIIYCNSARDTIQNSIDFIKIIDSPPLDIKKTGDKEILILQKNIAKLLHKDYYLIKCLDKRIAFHFGNLPQSLRIQIEDLYREGHINYIFCTSTLLEGVNLPAKNVFILSNWKGPGKLNDIDFWNLAGRAGRLTKELSGNIICIKDNPRNWTEKDISILQKTKPIELKNSPKDYLKKKQLEKIEEILKTGDYETNERKKKEILKYISNIICIDTLLLPAGHTSPLIEKLVEDNKLEIIELAKEKTNNIKVPIGILTSNRSILLSLQNKAYNYVKENGEEKSTLGNKVSYDECKKILILLSQIYEWDKEDRDINIKRIPYFSVLMNKWINGESLHQIIQEGVNYAHDSKSEILIDRSNNITEVFNKNNTVHINHKINEIIGDIEKILRFALEKYFNNYFLICSSVFGEENSGFNWASFLEYGTINTTIIGLQSIGLSRQASKYIYEHHYKSIKIKDGKFYGLENDKIMNSMSSEHEYYLEISKII